MKIRVWKSKSVKLVSQTQSALQQQWKMAPQDVNAIAQKIRQYCNAVLETRPIFSDQDQDQDQIYKTKIKTKTETARPRQDHSYKAKTKTKTVASGRVLE